MSVKFIFIPAEKTKDAIRPAQTHINRLKNEKIFRKIIDKVKLYSLCAQQPVKFFVCHNGFL